MDTLLFIQSPDDPSLHVGCTGCEAEWCAGSTQNHPNIPWIIVSGGCPPHTEERLNDGCPACSRACIRCADGCVHEVADADRTAYIPAYDKRPLLKCCKCPQTYLLSGVLL